jgi:hypothetical protein
MSNASRTIPVNAVKYDTPASCAIAAIGPPMGPGSAEQEQRYTLRRVRDTVGIHAASVFSTSLIQ